MPLQDVQVTIDVAYPAPRIGLGRPVILAQKTGAASYEEYATLEALRIDFPIGTKAEAKAGYIFMQPNRPDTVAVATYDSDIAATLENYFNRPWHFALVANDLQADQVAAATFIDGKTFKFVVVQVKDNTGREAVVNKQRTIIFDHDVVDEYLDAAAVGNLASLPVGSITWKFQNVKGITPRYLNDTEMTAIDGDNAIVYVVKAGKAQLSEGKLANGEYIDVLHGQDWVKVDMENEIQSSLVNAAQAGSKLPYDARGISAISAAATTTLQRGFRNGIIAVDEDGLPDYTLTTLTREQSDPQDRNDRIYRGLSFEFSNAGAIHEARVKGSILV